MIKVLVAACALFGLLLSVNAASLKVSGAAQQKKLIKQVKPDYPPDAKAKGIQGTVKLKAVINKDGTVKNLELIRGPEALVPATLEAVKQWVYEPTLLNGQPVEVITEIDVNYALSK